MDNTTKNYIDSFNKWVATVEVNIEYSEMLIRQAEEQVAILNKKIQLESEQLETDRKTLKDAKEERSKYLKTVLGIE